MPYFDTFNTLDEIKAEYKRLVMIHHPDKGGDVTIMQAINIEYAAYTNPAPRQQRLYPKKERAQHSGFSYNAWTSSGPGINWQDLANFARKVSQDQTRREQVKREAYQMRPWYESMIDKANKLFMALGLSTRWIADRIRQREITIVSKDGKSKLKIIIHIGMREVHVSGDTYDIRQYFKNLGFGWDRRSKYWYWNPDYCSSGHDQPHPRSASSNWQDNYKAEDFYSDDWSDDWV